VSNPYTGSLEETPEQKEARINSMLNCMVVEASLFALEHEEEPPKFTNEEIADFCGCSRETIRRIEKQALEKLKGLLG
jgi:DNA-directed RNA polymerase specialized sigma24 family protein